MSNKKKNSKKIMRKSMHKDHIVNWVLDSDKGKEYKEMSKEFTEKTGKNIKTSTIKNLVEKFRIMHDNFIKDYDVYARDIAIYEISKGMLEHTIATGTIDAEAVTVEDNTVEIILPDETNVEDTIPEVTDIVNEEDIISYIFEQIEEMVSRSDEKLLDEIEKRAVKYGKNVAMIEEEYSIKLDAYKASMNEMNETIKDLQLRNKDLETQLAKSKSANKSNGNIRRKYYSKNKVTNSLNAIKERQKQFHANFIG